MTNKKVILKLFQTYKLYYPRSFFWIGMVLIMVKMKDCAFVSMFAPLHFRCNGCTVTSAESWTQLVVWIWFSGKSCRNLAAWVFWHETKWLTYTFWCFEKDLNKLCLKGSIRILRIKYSQECLSYLVWIAINLLKLNLINEKTFLFFFPLFYDPPKIKSTIKRILNNHCEYFH